MFNSTNRPPRATRITLSSLIGLEEPSLKISHSLEPLRSNSGLNSNCGRFEIGHFIRNINNINSLFQLRVGMHNIMYSLNLTGWSYAIPRATQDVARCFSSYSLAVSHTLTVVLWPIFVHSIALNNKGYKAHKEMGHVL